MNESQSNPSRPSVGDFPGRHPDVRVAGQRRAEAVLIWALWLATMFALRPILDWFQDLGARLPLVGAAIHSGVRAALET